MLSERFATIGSTTAPSTYWSMVVEVMAQSEIADSAIRLSADVLPQGRYVERAAAGARKPRTPKALPTVETLSSEDAYIRPNGQEYHARTWGDHGDVAALRKAREVTTQAFSEGKGSPLFTLLYGAPGCGKTALVEAAFGESLFTILGTGDTEVADMIGGYIQTPSGGFEWVDGDLVRAAETGGVYFIDEIGLIDPKVLSIVYGLMDGRREITITANPERGTVKAHPEFYVVAATNPNAPGVRLSEALLSRFTVQTEMTTDWNLARKLGVSTTMVTAAQNLAKKQASHEVSWAPQFRELLAFRDISEAFGVSFAISNLLAAAPEMDRPVVADVLTRAFGSECKPAKI
jgi:nitric oxide reductase NorQ protein